MDMNITLGLTKEVIFYRQSFILNQQPNLEIEFQFHPEKSGELGLETSRKFFLL
jgi:imidazoleglycerol phosphate synthase glutamine amidotransferase subunit HisH